MNANSGVTTDAVRVPQLPEDIIIYILRSLAEGRDKSAQYAESPSRKASLRALGACKRVCRVWRELCTPLQWHAVAYLLKATETTYHIGGRKDPWKEPNDKRRTVATLTDYFKNHPELAKHVKVLTLDVFSPPKPQPLWHGFFDSPAQLAELLRYLPNLKDLHISNMTMDLDPKELAEVHGALTFPKLEQLTLRVWERVWSATITRPSQLMFPLFLFQEIDQVMIFRHNHVDPDAPLAMPEDMQGDMTKCRVRSFSFSTGDLLLHEHLNVVTRIFETGVMHTLDLSHVSVVPFAEHIAPLLKKVGPTLKRLSIGFMAWSLLAEDVTNENYDWLYELPTLEFFELRLHACTPGLQNQYEWVVITNTLSFFLPDAPCLREIVIEVTDNPHWFTHLVEEDSDMRSYLEDLFEMPPKLESVTFSNAKYQDYKFFEDAKEQEVMRRALPRLCASRRVQVGRGREELDIPGLKERCVKTTRELADVGYP